MITKLKFFYKLNLGIIKIPVKFYIEPVKEYQNSYGSTVETGWPNNMAWDATMPSLKLYHKARVTKTPCYWKKNRGLYYEHRRLKDVLPQLQTLDFGTDAQLTALEKSQNA